MDLVSLVIAVVVGVIVVAILLAMNISSKQKAMEEYLGHLEDFSATQKVIGVNGVTGLAVDEQRKKICLIDHMTKQVVSRIFSYKDLLSSEIFEDGEAVSRTERSSQIGGALIGGLAFGGVGAIIGGLSGKTRTSDKVKIIDLRLTVNDTANPLHDVRFLDLETKKESFLYVGAINQVRHWHGLMEVLIKRADADDKAANMDESLKSSPGSLADELKKLAELRDSGVLSGDEFEQQKMRLLNA